MPAALRAASDLGVQALRVFAELAHVAEHQPRFAAAGASVSIAAASEPGLAL